MTSVMDQLGEALWIMVLGMVLVYSFLGILILGLKLIANRYAPRIEDTETQPVTPGVSAQPKGLDPRLVAAITSAIQQYRAQEGRS
ncbi:OadG family protein [Shewanella litorisediminis]|uniref:Probable oxaloacetate decarboxylase gamma chain n=1 Tax=Shewanella litorisediminis TaxID=1173586 RepID=A0ABX7G6D5_9GAMM|nr:OadG family protein [Shewanella litorisediminis]MCL2917672.1 OadG family protein [Shewanella litorisediminis]QRH02793.1 OadG family protein [Shewanella litorisediminis]